jgi:hypothetical protein
MDRLAAKESPADLRSYRVSPVKLRNENRRNVGHRFTEVIGPPRGSLEISRVGYSGEYRKDM